MLPMTLSLTLFSFLSGVGVSTTGYYTPFMIIGITIATTGAFLISTTWTVSSPASKWVGFQVILGAGAGLGLQQAHTAAQTVLSPADVPTGAVVLIFSHVIGGAISIPIAQNVFTARLLGGLEEVIPDLESNVTSVLTMGATGLREAFTDPDVLEKVLVVYNHAVRGAFLCGAVLAAVAVLVSLGMEWKSIKKAKIGDIGARSAFCAK